ncbi:MAG: bifunctional DNA primase/polymerase, partial [Chthoniobacter sp.]|uniref:bifunctional DNA primase/polymerase n=1 Tax=Chthoniobacter sp. TaxID=2510640 RepID=UPI0032A7F093
MKTLPFALPPDKAINYDYYPRVKCLRQLLGNDAVMVACQPGTKKPKQRWGRLTLAAMSKPSHLGKLETHNIGIVLGTTSNGLCSIDLDDDAAMDEFLRINPHLCESLRSVGESGCNVWVRIIGDYPASCKITWNDGEAAGEWRADGNQTIISGKHPSGCEYTIVVEEKPAEIEFGKINWPKDFRVGLLRASAPIVHSNTVTQLHRSHSHSVTQCTQVGASPTAFAISSF